MATLDLPPSPPAIVRSASTLAPSQDPFAGYRDGASLAVAAPISPESIATTLNNRAIQMVREAAPGRVEIYTKPVRDEAAHRIQKEGFPESAVAALDKRARLALSLEDAIRKINAEGLNPTNNVYHNEAVAFGFDKTLWKSANYKVKSQEIGQPGDIMKHTPWRKNAIRKTEIYDNRALLDASELELTKKGLSKPPIKIADELIKRSPELKEEWVAAWAERRLSANEAPQYKAAAKGWNPELTLAGLVAGTSYAATPAGRMIHARIVVDASKELAAMGDTTITAPFYGGAQISQEQARAEYVSQRTGAPANQIIYGSKFFSNSTNLNTFVLIDEGFGIFLDPSRPQAIPARSFQAR